MKYQCTITVEAHKIVDVGDPHAWGNNHRGPDGKPLPTWLNIRLENGMIVTFDPDRVLGSTPLVGDYWVTQNGHSFLSSKATFERQYSPVVCDPGSPTAQAKRDYHCIYPKDFPFNPAKETLEKLRLDARARNVQPLTDAEILKVRLWLLDPSGSKS